MQNLIYQYQRRSQESLTNATAHAFGINSMVLRRLIADAAVDQRARTLGLAISDETIAAAARADPSMQDASGQFNRAMFDQALRNSSLSRKASLTRSGVRNISASSSNTPSSTASMRPNRWSRRWRAPRRRPARSTISCCLRVRPAIFPPRRRRR